MSEKLLRCRRHSHNTSEIPSLFGVWYNLYEQSGGKTYNVHSSRCAQIAGFRGRKGGGWGERTLPEDSLGAHRGRAPGERIRHRRGIAAHHSTQPARQPGTAGPHRRRPGRERACRARSVHREVPGAHTGENAPGRRPARFPVDRSPVGHPVRGRHQSHPGEDRGGAIRPTGIQREHPSLVHAGGSTGRQFRRPGQGTFHAPLGQANRGLFGENGRPCRSSQTHARAAARTRGESQQVESRRQQADPGPRHAGPDFHRLSDDRIHLGRHDSPLLSRLQTSGLRPAGHRAGSHRRRLDHAPGESGVGSGKQAPGRFPRQTPPPIGQTRSGICDVPCLQVRAGPQETTPGDGHRAIGGEKGRRLHGPDKTDREGQEPLGASVPDRRIQRSDGRDSGSVAPFVQSRWSGDARFRRGERGGENRDRRDRGEPLRHLQELQGGLRIALRVQSPWMERQDH